MSVHSRTVILWGLACLGLAVGFWLGRGQGDLEVKDEPIVAPTIAESEQRNPSGMTREPERTEGKNSGYVERVASLLKTLSNVRDEKLSSLFNEWAREDPIPAFDTWVKTPHADKMSGVASNLMEELCKEIGFRRVVQLASSVEHGPVRGSLFEGLAYQVDGTNDGRSAMDALLLSAPKNRRDRIMSIALRTWTSKASLGEASDWIDLQRKHFDDEGVARLERAASEQFIWSKPEESAAWLLGRATEESLSAHIDHIATTWASDAPNAAGKWLASLPSGPQNDSAFANFSRIIVRVDPQSAAEWAMEITDAGFRTITVAGIVRQWQQTDPKAATTFAEEYLKPAAGGTE